MLTPQADAWLMGWVCPWSKLAEQVLSPQYPLSFPASSKATTPTLTSHHPASLLTSFGPQNLLESCLLVLNTAHDAPTGIYTPPYTPDLLSRFTSISAPDVAFSPVSAQCLGRNWQREWAGG